MTHRSHHAEFFEIHPHGPFQAIPNISKTPWRRRAVQPTYETLKSVRPYGFEKEERGAVVYARLCIDTSAVAFGDGQAFEAALARELKLKPGSVAVASVDQQFDRPPTCAIQLEISAWDPRNCACSLCGREG